MNEDTAASLVEHLHCLTGGDKDKALAIYDQHMQSPAAKKRLTEWAEQEPGDPDLEEARRALLPGLLIAEAKFLEIPRQWPRVFRRGLATVECEVSDERIFTGLAQLQARGAPATRDLGYRVRGPRYYLEGQGIGLAAEIFKDQVDDGSYIKVFSVLALGLAESFNQTEEILHANVLTTGMVYNPAIGADEVPLFSPAHPYADGVYSNVFDCELNEAALERAAVLINRMPLANGMLSRTRPRTLVVPIELEFVAHRLMAGLAEDIAKNPKGYPQSYCVLDFLKDQKAWFLTTSIEGLISLEWEPFRLDLRVEGDKLVLEGSQSYGAGYNNPRGCFASFPGEAKSA